MVTMPKNDDEAAEMEAKAAAYRQKQAEQELADRREKVKPLREFVESDAFQSVAEQAQKLMPEYAAIDGIDVHLRPLGRFMRNLREGVNAYAPPEGAEQPAADDTPPAEPDAGE